MLIRSYSHKDDYTAVSKFLVEIYQPGDRLRNWLQPRWEYMHYHPFIKELDLTQIGIFEDNHRICGVVHFESQPFQVYFQVRPGYEYLKHSMVEYAEKNFRGMSKSKNRMVRALYIHDNDTELTEYASSNGYEKWGNFAEEHSLFRFDKPVPSVTLPDGFHLQSLDDELDLRKVNRVLWRGFNHPGPPPDEEIEGRREVMRAPNFRKDLTIVVIAPDGNYVSYCGMWFVPENRVAYVEPVATDPNYRRMGLGRAAVLESLRRVSELGADVAWVGSGQKFYEAIGFTKMFSTIPWVKYLD